jgi:hypothetical protein
MPKSTKQMQSTTTRTRTRKSSTTTPTTTIPSSLSSLNHAEIAHRAYQLFLAAGAAHGRDVEHWLQAESELRDRSAAEL